MIDEGLINLKESLKLVVESDSEKTSNILRRINSFCLNTFNYSRLPSILNEVFNNHPKLLDICNYNDDKISSTVIETMCDFLINLLAHAKELLLPFCVLLKNYLLGIVNMNKSSSKMKELSLKTLQKIFTLTANTEITMNEDQFLSDVFRLLKSKPTILVLSSLLKLIGKMSSLYPSSFIIHADLYKKIAMDNLTNEIVGESKSSHIISGCCEGLRYFYSSLPASEYNDDFLTVCNLLFKVLQMDPWKRFAAVKSCLRFLTDHWNRLQSRLFDDIDVIFSSLLVLCEHQNNDLRNEADHCMNSLLKSIGEDIHQKTVNNLLTEKEKDVLNFLVQTFTRNLQKKASQSESSKIKQIDINIRGFGHLIKACTALIPKETVEMLFTTMVDHIWKEFKLDQGKQFRDEFPNVKIYRIFDILISLTKILGGLLEFKNLDDIQYHRKLKIITRLTHILIEFFPRISNYKIEKYKNVFSTVINTFKHNETVSRIIIEEIVYQAVIFSCSFPIPPDYSIVQDFSVDVTEIENLNETEMETNSLVKTFAASSVRDFLPLWNVLLKSDKPCDEVTATIFNSFVGSTFKIIDRLDLSYRTSNINLDSISTNPVDGQTASNSKDFVIFVSLCELFQFAMKHGSKEKISKWIVFCVNKLVSKSLELPLVSGFYKILCAIIKLLQSVKFFDSHCLDSTENKDEDNLIALIIMPDLKRIIYSLLENMCNYNDELLITCLSFLVHMPLILWLEMQDDIHNQKCLVYIKMAIQLGNCYMPLGHSCLDMLERWLEDLPTMEPWLYSILPSYRSLLLHSQTLITVENDLNQKQLRNNISAKRGNKNLFRTLRLIQEAEQRRLFEQIESGTTENYSCSKLENLQNRFLRILGRMGINYSRYFTGYQNHASANINWNKSPAVIIKYSVPFVDSKPEIGLECFLSSVCSLALNSTDSQVKSLSAEVLHAIILVIIGQSGSALSPSDRLKFIPTWSYILTTSFKLATDMNKVCKTLFSEVLFQIAYWYSYPHNIHLPDAEYFIDCLFYIIICDSGEESFQTTTTDTASGNMQRDFAGRVLRHLLESSFNHGDQNTGKLREMDKHSMENILDRIYNLCQNFSPFKRLGAVFIFNSIFPILQKHEDLLKSEIFNVLYYLIECQRLSEKDKHLGTLRQLKHAFKNIEETISLYNNELKKENIYFKKPPSWSSATLEFTIRWMLGHYLSDLRHFRHNSMSLSEKFATFYDKHNAGVFFEALYNKKGRSYFLEKFENLEIFSIQPGANNPKLWMNTLEASLEAYRWLLNFNFINIANYFSTEGTSKLFFAINNFLRCFSTLDLSKDLFYLSENIIRFFTDLFSTHNDLDIGTLVDTDSLVGFFVVVSLQPYRLSLDVRNKKKIEKWFSEIHKLYNGMNTNFQHLYLKKLSKTLSKYDFSKGLDGIRDSVNDDLNIYETEYLFKFLKMVNCSVPNIDLLDFSINESLYDEIIKRSSDKSSDTSQTKIVETAVFDYIFNVESEFHLERMISNLATERMHSVFYVHENIILQNILLNSEKLSRYITKENMTHLLPVLLKVLNYGIANNIKEKLLVVQILVKRWSIICDCQQKFSDVLELLLKMIFITPEVCSEQPIFEYFCNILSSETLSGMYKNEIFPIFTHFYKYSMFDENSSTKMINSIKIFFSKNFQGFSKDISSIISLNKSYVNALSIIFQCLHIPCSIDNSIQLLKEVIIPIFCRESLHPLDGKLNENLVQFYSKRSCSDKQSLLKAFEAELRKLVEYNNINLFLNKFYLVFILHCDCESLYSFFGSRINSLKENLQSTVLKDANDEQLQSIEINLKILTNIYKSLGPFLGHDKICLRESDIISDLSRKCSAILRFTQCTCHMIYNVRSWAFNCFCAVVLATQSEEKFYTDLLLKSNWSMFLNIILSNSLKTFTTDTFTQKMIIIEYFAIRKDQSDIHYFQPKKKTVNPNIFTSEFLSDSSLNFDASALEDILMQKDIFTVGDPQTIEQTDSRCLIRIMVPDDVVNNHCCMKTFVSLLYHMKDLGIIKSNVGQEIPPWMKIFYNSFLDPQSYIDIKYFISKLILNCHTIFKPYASLWLPCLIEFVTSTQTSINQYVLSILTLVTDWSAHMSSCAAQVSRNTLNTLIKFLSENCYSDNPIITNKNLELFSTCLKTFSCKLDVPYQSIFFNLQDLKNNNRIICSIKMMALVIQGGYHFMGGADNATKTGFIKQMNKNLRNKLKTIYGPAFEFLGILLNQMLNKSDINDDWGEDLQREIKSALEYVFTRNHSDYVTCLSLIAKNSSDFIFPYLSTLISILALLKEDDLNKALEIIGCCSFKEEEEWISLFKKLFEINVFENIQFKSTSTIQILIQTIHHTISYVADWSSNPDINPLILKCFDHCLPCCRHEEKDVRAKFFQLFVDLSLYKENIGTEDSFLSALLAGLMDPDKNISQSVRNFCSSSKLLPTETFERAHTILDILFPSSVPMPTKFLNHSKFLSVVTNVLLEMTSHSPDFTKPLFQNQLDDNVVFETFTAAHITSQTSRSFLPNFIKPNMDTNVHFVSHEGKFKIPTSANIPKKVEHFDWIKSASTFHSFNPETSQNNSDTESIMEWSSTNIPGIDMSLSLQSHKSFLFLSTNEMEDDKEIKEDVFYGKNSKKSGVHHQSFDSNREFTHIEKRDSSYFQNMAVKKQKFLEKKRIIEQNLKKSAVFLYRNYHTGKLPDIRVPNCSIIAPVQMLAQLDEGFSKDLFCYLYNSFLKELSSPVSQEALQKFCTKISLSFNNILNSCNINDKILASTCLQIAIDNSSLVILKPDLVYNASCFTDNKILAVILLEKYLVSTLEESSCNNEGEPPKKRIKLLEIDNIEKIVSLLMKLYKSLDLNEEIIGLTHVKQLTSNFPLINLFREALAFECSGNYIYSYKLYNQLLTEYQQSSADSNEYSFNTEMLLVSQNGLINSLQKLCKWDDLATFLDGLIVDTFQPSSQEIFKSLINSKLRLSVLRGSSTTHGEDIFSKVQNSFPNCELLMPMEMGLYYIVNENYCKAREYCDIAHNNILLNGDYFLSKEKEIQMLQSLHLLNEMSDFLGKVDKINDLVTLEKWSERSADLENNSLEFWEQLVFYRTCYFRNLKTRMPSFSQKIDDYIHNLQFQFIDVCIHNNRTTPALNYLRSCKNFCRERGKNFEISWDLKYSKIHLQTAGCHGQFVNVNDVKDVCSSLILSIKRLNKLYIIEDTSFSLKWEYFLNLGDSFWSIANICLCHWLELSNSNMINSVSQLINSSNVEDKESLISSLLEMSFSFLSRIISMYKESSYYNDRKQLSQALMVLSDFCDSQISNYEECSVTSDKCLPSGIISSYVESTLYSMKLGDFSAKNKFPRVLKVVDKYGPDEISFNTTIDMCVSIPSWLYIPWLDQMIPYLFGTNHSLVEPIIIRIANEYPHALFYPFFLQIDLISSIPSIIEKIEILLLPLRLMRQFRSALVQMRGHEDYLQNWFQEAKEMFDGKAEEMDRQMIINKYQTMYSTVFESDRLSTSTSRFVPSISKFQEDFSNQFRSFLVDKFQSDCSSIRYLSRIQFSKIYKIFDEKLKEWKSKICKIKNLDYFSYWLSKYNIQEMLPKSNESNQNWLEVPGQYNNVTSRPFPEKHIKIFKFDSEIQIMNSKQQPIKINMLGSNEQSYSFLLKSGEDLRQDFRIEQMFGVMNDIFCHHNRTVNALKDHFLITYNVIPISKEIGLLEWIGNTVTLKDFYWKTVTTNERKLYVENFQEYYKHFPNTSSYTDSWEKYDNGEINQLFEKHERTVAKFDLLRRSFRVISKSQESFYRLRLRFIQQYAVMVTAHYILGIGDRHLSNFLIDESTGNIIGIDFGYAFGMATIFLPIPELIPFRLTSTIVQFLKPSGVEGKFTQTLDNALSILSNNETTIMSIMNVFLTNQITDWARMSRITNKSLEDFPQMRINISHRKLKREDPLILLYDELNLKYSQSRWFRFMKEYQWSETNKSQTNRLISMATNVGFLSRVWKGFEPFL